MKIKKRTMLVVGLVVMMVSGLAAWFVFGGSSADVVDVNEVVAQVAGVVESEVAVGKVWYWAITIGAWGFLVVCGLLGIRLALPRRWRTKVVAEVVAKKKVLIISGETKGKKIFEELVKDSLGVDEYVLKESQFGARTALEEGKFDLVIYDAAFLRPDDSYTREVRELSGDAKMVVITRNKGVFDWYLEEVKMDGCFYVGWSWGRMRDELLTLMA